MAKIETSREIAANAENIFAAFSNADFVANAEDFLKAANEQNLDRVEAEVCSPKSSPGNK